MHECPASCLVYDIEELVRAHVDTVAEIVSYDDLLVGRRSWINREFWTPARTLTTEMRYCHSMTVLAFHGSPLSC
jgi:hypothetical protein